MLPAFRKTGNTLLRYDARDLPTRCLCAGSRITRCREIRFCNGYTETGADCLSGRLNQFQWKLHRQKG
jgi:hypothetical protein